MNKKFYLTTAIPYVNARPHIGHALEYVVCDAIHRYHELAGYQVHLVSGADENALKNVQAAEKAKVPVQEFLDRNARVFEDFYELLEVNLDEFRRGSDKKYHWPGVQKLWKIVAQNGDIYKKKYKGLYCVGCEAFKTSKDLVDGKCPDHDRKPVEVEETNYFFRLARFQERLLHLIESGEYQIVPENRKREMLSFIKSGLEDFSISRSNERAKGVGVPVPGDNTQKIYVWFDALAIYITGVGWGYDEKLWKKWWPADLHIVGKDIIRFHAVYWPAILLSAGLPLPRSLLVHGFVNSGGRKMSKTTGNVIDPYEVIDKYDVEPTRYYLLSQIPRDSDGDFTYKHFEEVYQADLANGLGNLVSRVAKLAQDSGFAFEKSGVGFYEDVEENIKEYNFDLALKSIWEVIGKTDQLINKKKPWELSGTKLENVLEKLILQIRLIAYNLKPFLPETASKIENQFKGPRIKSDKPLFPRLNRLK